MIGSGDAMISDDPSSYLPKEYTYRMRILLGDEYPDFEASYRDNRYYGLRINPLKTDEADIAGILSDIGADAGDSVPWCREGYYYDKDSCQAGRSPYHEAGAYYIQEPSAMSVVTALDPAPGERVCDLCAAPGGKTTHIAGRMMGQGVLIANEIVPDRARILSRNVERMGVPNCIVTNASPQELALKFPGYFHKVCVDAPCSGEGMFRKNPEAAGEWSPANVEMCGGRQSDILDAAADMVMPGGVIVYSTCTFEPDENEKVISGFLKTHPDWHISGTGLDMIPDHGRSEWADGDPEVELCTRIWPHVSRGEGHFIAKLIREGEYTVSPAGENAFGHISGSVSGGSKPKRRNGDFGKKNVILCDEVIRFLHTELDLDGIPVSAERIHETADSYFLLPDGFDPDGLNRIRVIRPGLEVANKKKNRLEPAHALAMAVSKRHKYNACNLTMDEAICYLRGESFTPASGPVRSGTEGSETPVTGWVIASINGVSMGWGKLTGNMLKNHYPKGLRRDLSH